jgi:hypothetical protein
MTQLALLLNAGLSNMEHLLHRHSASTDPMEKGDLAEMLARSFRYLLGLSHARINVALDRYYPPALRLWLHQSARAGAAPRSRPSGGVFVKIAVRVEELKGRIKLAFPASYPQAAMLTVMVGSITTVGS